MKSELKWKDIYNKYKTKRYGEITGIKKEDVFIEANPSNFIKSHAYLIIIASLIIVAITLFTFRSDLKVAGLVLLFLLGAGALFVFFNYYKIGCVKEGLYIKFGLQQGTFKYDRIKNVYLSRFNDSSYLFSIRTYNIVILYEDNLNRLKELYFDVTFTDKQQLVEFLDNFNVKEIESTQYNNFERFKLLKKIGKILMIVAFIVIVGMYAYIRIHG